MIIYPIDLAAAVICGPIALQSQEQLLAIAMEEEGPEDPPKLKGGHYLGTPAPATRSHPIPW
jgi:hypothetical protein